MEFHTTNDAPEDFLGGIFFCCLFRHFQWLDEVDLYFPVFSCKTDIREGLAICSLQE